MGSYWTRIRDKIGHLSRVEVVVAVLREGFRVERAEYEATLARVEATAREGAVTQSAPEGLWHRRALERHPTATVVAVGSGAVAYANLEAGRLLRSTTNALVGRPLGDLAEPSHRAEMTDRMDEFWGDEAATRVTLGMERPFYALRRDGTNFRAVLEAEAFDGPDGRHGVVSLREFMLDAASALRAATSPYVPDDVATA